MLEVLAFQYTQLPQPGTFLVSFLAIVIGAVLAASLMAPPDGLLSRSYYVQRIGIASLALVAVQAAWLWYPTALAYGVSWLMLASDLLSALAYGAYMIRIAQARSRDAYGHTGRAWFALVPLVNLVLLFKPSQTPDAAPGSTGSALVGLGLIILSRLAVPVLLNAVEQRTVAGMQDPEIQAAATALRVRALGTAAALDILIVAEGAPAEIQTGLTLTAVTRSDLHLTYEFSLDLCRGHQQFLQRSHALSDRRGQCDAALHPQRRPRTGPDRAVPCRMHRLTARGEVPDLRPGDHRRAPVLAV